MVSGDGGALEGTVLGGRYRVVRALGAGGMSTVHLAADEALGREVAIKLFRDGVSGLSDADRRTAEARTLASLSHPGLVTLFDAVLGGDPNFLVMEYVDGDDLAARVRRDGALPVAQARSVLGVAADALDAVHARGVVHRDIKPANLLLPRAGSVPVKVADFGIARLIDSTRLTTAGSLIGTAAYLSPEQLRGHDIGPASDVYSLALVVLESLTAMRGFEGGPAEAATARLSTPPRGLDRVDPTWRALLERMLDADPSARPSAAEVAATAAVLPDSADDPTIGAPAPTMPLPAADDPTAVLTNARSDAPTLVLSAGDQAATEVLIPEPADDAPSSPGSPPRRRRGVAVPIAIVAAALVLVAAGLGLAGASGAFSTPEVELEYPTVDGDLGVHLERLQREVEP